MTFLKQEITVSISVVFITFLNKVQTQNPKISASQNRKIKPPLMQS